MTDVSEQSVAEVLTAPDRFQCVMGAMGVRLWSADRPLPDWAKDDVVTEYVKADAVEWQPMASAPKDGAPVDLWCICNLKWDKAGIRMVNRKWGPSIDWMGTETDSWGLSEDYEPTHWMRVIPPAALLAAPRAGEGK